jgi:KUP system potassium uptake protein
MRITTPNNRRTLPPAALAAMGIVFGDIGTSPLYTLQVAVKAASPAGAISPEAVLGIVSLIFWSLIAVISIKYAGLIMRANNHGEGGILALLALISPQNAKRGGWRAVMVVVGLIGATLLYGDGTITPAISVLSAVEGIKLYAPQLGRFIVPLTLIILVALFLIQRTQSRHRVIPPGTRNQFVTAMANGLAPEAIVPATPSAPPAPIVYCDTVLPPPTFARIKLK